MDNIKVIIWGFGAMGSGIANMILRKKGIDIVGVCDRDSNKANKSMYDVLNLERGNRLDLLIMDDIKDIVSKNHIDIALICTDSYTKGTYEKIIFLLEHKINVISTAEEMAFPKASSPKLADSIHVVAKEKGVSVLGTGINPGLMMDLLAIALTGACEEVEHIECERINSLSPFGHTVMEEQGVGITVKEFDKKTREGTLAGHVGFAESIGMITEGIGWKLDEPITQSSKPIVSNVYRETPYAKVEPGNIAGVNMEGYGIVNGEKKIEMKHPQQIEPQLEGVSTGDYIRIKGSPNINMSIKPEVPGGIGTIAMCVNMIPHVINARAGLKTMLDLPVPRAIMGDMRELIE